jgi:hypothetical protein
VAGERPYDEAVEQLRRYEALLQADGLELASDEVLRVTHTTLRRAQVLATLAVASQLERIADNGIPVETFPGR